MKRLVLVAVIIGVTGFFGSLQAQGRGRGNGRGRGQDEQASQAATVQRFSSTDVHVIRAWFASPQNRQGLPPGLAKREQLPPGLQKQLVRNGKLPPGLEKKIQPLPQPVEAQLPPLPEGIRRVAIAGNVVLWNQKTSVILDVIAKVF